MLAEGPVGDELTDPVTVVDRTRGTRLVRRVTRALFVPGRTVNEAVVAAPGNWIREAFENRMTPVVEEVTVRLRVTSIVIVANCRALFEGRIFTEMTSVPRIVNGAVTTGRVPAEVLKITVFVSVTSGV